MHFLCLHGMGTNSRIFKSQTSAIRHALGPDHTYEWLDGSHPTQMAPNIGDFVSTNEEFLEYADQSSPESCIQALLALDSFIEEEGPFDAVMAFSQGAALASSLMIYRLRKDPERESASPTFHCAVFFSGGPPEDPSGITSGSRRVMNYQADGEIIGIPTVHIWGKYDQLYPTFGPVLSKLCKASDREEFIHGGGHEIPGPRDQVTVARTVQLIKRTIGRTAKT